MNEPENNPLAQLMLDAVREMMAVAADKLTNFAIIKNDPDFTLSCIVHARIFTTWYVQMQPDDELLAAKLEEFWQAWLVAKPDWLIKIQSVRDAHANRGGAEQTSHSE